MIKAIVKEITPDFVLYQWRKYKKKKKEQRLNNLRVNIIHYLESIPPKDMTNEQQEVFDYLKRHPLAVFPYDYTKRYTPEKITVYTDSEKGLHYVLQDGKRLYFKKGWNEEKVQAYYNGLLIEQDTSSPHRYETADFHVLPGDIVVDAGVAEGNFALSVVEQVKKLYLFEPDKDWIKPLEATFSTWKDKVYIVNSCISDKCTGDEITLDEFFKNTKVNFVKADIEGAEIQLLKGAQAILSRPTPMKVVLCTYHKHNDAETLDQILTEKGFHTEFSKGYMIFSHEVYDKLSPPYLRRGLIRGIK